jgi:hypothetical protein
MENYQQRYKFIFSSDNFLFYLFSRTQVMESVVDITEKSLNEVHEDLGTLFSVEQD